MDKKVQEENRYVRQEDFNKVVYEIKIDIQKIGNKIDTEIMEVKGDNRHLTTILQQLSKNIEDNTKMMGKLSARIAETEALYQEMRLENKGRDHRIEDLQNHQKKAENTLASKSKEVWGFYGVLATGAFMVIVAIINVAHNFFQ